MKKGLKALLLVMCAIVLVVATVFTTLAYMTSKTDTIENTFSVGNVTITMDEAEYLDGDYTGGRTKSGNSYELISSKEYVKDPMIDVAVNSEDAYIFVKVDITDNANSLEGLQLTANWTQIENTNVYYYNTPVTGGTADIPVFKALDDATVEGATVRIADSVNADTVAPTVNVTGYAVQAEGFVDALAAWNTGAPADWKA